MDLEVFAGPLRRLELSMVPRLFEKRRPTAVAVTFVLVGLSVALAIWFVRPQSSRQPLSSGKNDTIQMPTTLKRGFPLSELWDDPAVVAVFPGAHLSGRSTSLLCFRSHPNKVVEVDSARGPFWVSRITGWRVRDRRRHDVLLRVNTANAGTEQRAIDAKRVEARVHIAEGVGKTMEELEPLIAQLRTATTVRDIEDAFEATKVKVSTNSLTWKHRYYKSDGFPELDLFVSIHRGIDGISGRAEYHLGPADDDEYGYVELAQIRSKYDNVSQTIRKGMSRREAEQALGAESFFRMGGRRSWLCLVYRCEKQPEEFVHVYYRRDDEGALHVYDWELSKAREIEGFQPIVAGLEK